MCLQERNYNIYLNHTSLLKAILLHSGVPEDKLSQASNVLCDAMVSAVLYVDGFASINVGVTFFCVSTQNEKLTKREVEAKFCNFSLSSSSVSILLLHML